uniref:Transposase n=1 Tax=Acrobeloides nanus TaxID=290746 RepID=A0A914D3R5_9BILA
MGHTIFGDDEWTFQQDGAPAHKARETQDFLRQLPRCHHGRRPLSQCQRRMAAQQPRSQPARLRNMAHLDGESMPEAPSERGIFETSFEESVKRNHLGRSGQDRRQLPQASPCLH